MSFHVDEKGTGITHRQATALYLGSLSKSYRTCEASSEKELKATRDRIIFADAYNTLKNIF